MYKSKVINLYQSLSTDETKALQKFIHSPIHNQHHDVTVLIDYLNGLKKITSDNVDRKVIHRILFKKRVFQESNVRHVFSYLFKSIEEFITYANSNPSELIKYKSLIKFYREKGLNNLLDSTIRKFEKLEEIEKQNADYFLDKFQVLNEITIANEQSTRYKENDFAEQLGFLDKFYIAEKLKQSSNVLSQQAIFGKEYEIDFMDSILRYIEQRDLLSIPSIAIHYYNYYMVKDSEEEKYFYQFKEVLINNTDAFEADELRDLYILGVNYNLRKANKGDKIAPAKVFELYELGLNNKALMPFGTLSHVTYRNIINTALYLKENHWALNFIHEYKDFLEEDVKEDTYNFNLAHYYSKIEDYNAAQKILATVDLKDENYNAKAKVLQLKMYYETEEYEVLESLLDSFWIYLKRKKHLSYHRDLWFKLIRYTRSIIHTNPGDHKRLEKILSNIKERQDLTEKKWLIAIVEQRLSKR
ncbi:MAG: hypothetical protein KDC67_09385 [Ignavibacteriae bacterium]|nr:hypothetical protein [Ignavibacteriota bacterium]